MPAHCSGAGGNSHCRMTEHLQEQRIQQAGAWGCMLRQTLDGMGWIMDLHPHLNASVSLWPVRPRAELFWCQNMCSFNRFFVIKKKKKKSGLKKRNEQSCKAVNCSQVFLLGGISGRGFQSSGKAPSQLFLDSFALSAPPGVLWRKNKGGQGWWQLGPNPASPTCPHLPAQTSLIGAR